jgi:hypothetical protein
VTPFRRWRAQHLFRSWVAYWCALLAFVAWRPLLEYWKISHSPSGHGTVGYSYSGGPLQLALWIAGPPLLLFIVWVATRSRTPDRMQEPEMDVRERHR